MRILNQSLNLIQFLLNQQLFHRHHTSDIHENPFFVFPKIMQAIQLDRLRQYTTCDISDALATLGKVGQLSEIQSQSPHPLKHSQTKVKSLMLDLWFCAYG